MTINKDLYPNISSFDPRTCISRKMRKCHRLVAQIFRKHLTPHGVTSSQLGVLYLLCKKQDVKQRDIVEMMVLEKSTVNRNLKRLLANGLVVQGDRKLLNITAKGMDLVEKVIPAWQQAMEEAKSKLKQEGVDAIDLILSNLK